MDIYNDISGLRSGFLEALYPTNGTQNANTLWVCRCDCGCGNNILVKRSHITRTKDPVKSCGRESGKRRGGTNLTRLLATIPPANSKTGIQGVTKDCPKGTGYRARADFCGVRYEIHGFATVEVAAIIRKSMQLELTRTGNIEHTRELADFYKSTF